MPTFNNDEEEWKTDDELEPPVEMETGYANFVLVDGIPAVGEDKVGKLVKALLKILDAPYAKGFSDGSALARGEEGITVPFDKEKGVFHNFCFCEYKDAKTAAQVVAAVDGYVFPPKFKLRVTSYDDLAKYKTYKDEYVPPEQAEFKPRENLLSWLMDRTAAGYASGRDQFVVRAGDSTQILWNGTDSQPSPSTAFQPRPNWCENMEWSPRGTYLATFHKPGIILWGGPNFSLVVRFQHADAKAIAFSPNEKYIITFSPRKNDNPNDPQACVVWDVRSGKRLRGYMGNPEELPTWPIFRWSHDDKYIARLAIDAVLVYETPEMGLAGKSLKYKGVRLAEWSPTENIISTFMPMQNNGNTPAKIALIEFPSRKEIRQKNLFNVDACNFFWHPQGTFLCVKVRMVNKSRKVTGTNLELFRISDKLVPVETLEIKEDVIDFAWEPKGTRFAVIVGGPPKPDVLFYDMKGKKGHELIHKSEKVAANRLYWSPRGRFIVLAGMRNLNGQLRFVDAERFDVLAQDEHFMATDLQWDPTGRYLSTSVSFYRTQDETGYRVWSFQGDVVHQATVDKFYNFLWRPRPPTFLSPEQVAKTKKTLKNYSEKYSKESDKLQAADAATEKQRRRKVLSEFQAWQEELRAEYAENAGARRAIRNGAESDEEAGMVDVEKVTTKIISQERVVLFPGNKA